MTYRAQPRRIRPTRGRTSPDSLASRVALARALGRPQPRGGGGMLPMVFLTMLLGLVVVFASTGLAIGGAAFSTFDELAEGLPAVARFEQLRFAQPTVVYDRTGAVELARFQAERRNVVTFEEIPKLVLDTTIAVEDRSFWTNQGYDPEAIAAAVAETLQGQGERGASTITQQFVRAPEIGLLPPEVLGPDADTYVRKAKEIIQAGRLTEYVTKTFGAEEGKKRIITAYLNQINYGHNAYGIAAAADVYFGKQLADLTPAEAALLAGLPQSPATLDPYRFAKADAEGRSIVPTCGSDPAEGCEDVAPIVRRDYILREGLAKEHGRWTEITDAELEAALDEPVVLAGDKPLIYTAPHFVWAMKGQLDQLLADREPAETGGYKVITTLDMRAQQLGERYIEAATTLAQLTGDEFDQAVRERDLSRDKDWMRVLQGKNVKNGALTAVDYRTGDVLSYVGSAGYYREDLASEQFDPKVDVVSSYRQPGSAFKPVMYATAFDERALTAGSVLLDVTTSFARAWQPKNADLLERGPISVREALHYSLNIPAIRAMDRVGPTAVAQASERAGLTFLGGPDSLERAGLAGAIGTVEVKMLELTATFGAFGNEGVVTQPRMILKITDDDGNTVHEAGQPVERQAWSPQAAWLVGDILRGNTDPAENLVWGPIFETYNGPDGAYRPLQLKTGTTNDIRDLTAYGLAAQPKDPAEPAIAVGVWMGNSDHTPPTVGDATLFGSDGPARVWQAFMRDYLQGEPVAAFDRPDKGLVETTIDFWSGGQPGEWTRDTTREWFINGTEPGSRNEVDEPGLLYREACGGSWYVDPLKAEKNNAPEQWKSDVRDWTARARRGPGARSIPYGTLTSYFWGESTWGGPIIPSDPFGCASPSPTFSFEPLPSDEPSAAPTEEPTRTLRPDPTRTLRPDPTRTLRPDPTRTLRPDPTRTPRPDPTRTPRPDPTRTPRPDPTDEPTPEPKPTRTPKPDPTRTPRPDPTDEPTPKPTRTPKPDPTEEPTPEPEPTPTPDPGGEEEGGGGDATPTPPSEGGGDGTGSIASEKQAAALPGATGVRSRRLGRRPVAPGRMGRRSPADPCSSAPVTTLQAAPRSGGRDCHRSDPTMGLRSRGRMMPHTMEVMHPWPPMT